MNAIEQVQPRNGETSANPPLMSVSEAAAVLARRRSELRTQETPTETTDVLDETLLGDQPSEESADGSLDESTDETQAEGEPTPDEEGQPTEAEADAEDAVLELDGEEVPLSEIKKWREGAMRQDDYQRKTQALAQTTQAISVMEQDLNRFGHAMQRVYADQMESMSRGLRQFESVDWAKLAAENPQQYTTRKEQFAQAKGAFERQQAKFQQFVGEYEQLAQRTLQAKAQAALPELKQRIRGWNDALYNERADFLVDKYGADRNLVNKVTDPWFWELANDAFTYRQGKQLPKVQAKVKRAPVNIKAGKPTQAPAKQAARKEMAAIPALSGRLQMQAAADLLARRRQT